MRVRDQSFQNIAKAEKALCDVVGPELAKMLRSIEQRFNVQFNGMQVVGTHEAGARWLNATCTLIS